MSRQPALDGHDDGVRLHYAVAGQGEPVLLPHGWPESSIAWRHVMPLLAKSGRRVWAIDLRGFGDSDKPAGGDALDNVARDVHEFIRVERLADGGKGVDVVLALATSPSRAACNQETSMRIVTLAAIPATGMRGCGAACAS